MRRFRPLTILFLFLAALSLSALPADRASAAPAKPKVDRKARKEAIQKLPEKYQQWLKTVDLLITDEELETFLALEQDYQRDAFMKRFWAARDTYKSTARNEFQERWEANVEAATSEFGTLDDDRARILLLNGPPNARIEGRCSSIIWPVEVWLFAHADRLRSQFIVVFYRKWGVGPFRIWSAIDGLGALFSNGAGGTGNPDLAAIASGCKDGDQIAGGIGWVLRQGMGYDILQQRMMAKPEEEHAGEWVSSFSSYSTDMPEGAVPLPAKLTLEFPGRYQNRTVVQGLVSVPANAAGKATLGGANTYNLLLNGEVLQNGELFDNFRYKFDFPPGTATTAPAPGSQGDNLPVVFQRYLRPGAYQMVIKLEDLNSGKIFREERTITVPASDRVAPAPPSADGDEASTRLLSEANAAISNGETSLKLVRPFGELQTGMQRFDTLTTGADIAKVTFALDGKAVFTKKNPPYSVELDLGNLPRPRTLTARAFDRAGAELASDELVINSAANRFQVRLVEPQRGKRYQGSLLARAETKVPDGQTVERVELFLNETRVATLFQPPWQQPIVLPKGEEIAYVRAVAYLVDGNSTENLVFVNAPEDLGEVNINFVELYTTVVDRQNRPVEGLEEKDFAVTEDGTKQDIARFERVTDLPIHAAVTLDVSGSMDKSLDKARQAALEFFQRIVRPKDRAAIVTFNDHPNLTVKFTNDVPTLAAGLAGLKAERGTSLYDSIIFTLYYFTGVRGQRALVLISDGKDEGSRFTFDDALDYARRAGVTVYAIGLGEDVDKRKLNRLAEETGGRTFFLKNVDELAGIYAQVEQELRSQYLIAYQSTNTSGGNNFRSVDLKVLRPGMVAKTIRGYYP
ncbi:MAG TPA: VWA domain-containing protein [Thermoanaerobaculia bacterium]|jgi:VWFA-related protein|nr:VWA domain-containing protein [Thermoanaerobaculia bacterium]